MTDYIKYGAVAVVIAAIYLVGYKHAESEGEAVLESLKVQHAQAIIAAQKEEKAKYEESIKSLTSSLERLRTEHNDRLHELQSFRARATDHDTCNRQRSDLARIAVELERVADRAIVYLEGGRK